MTRPTVSWPFGPTNPLEIARTVARFALDRLDTVDPEFAEQMRAHARAVGQSYWLEPDPVDNGGEVWTVAQLAQFTGVTTTAVRAWSERGIAVPEQDGRYCLPRRPDGKFDDLDVQEFLRVRDGHPLAQLVDQPARDTFCRCGHEQNEHDPTTGACRATRPDRCSCNYYRLGKRAR